MSWKPSQESFNQRRSQPRQTREAVTESGPKLISLGLEVSCCPPVYLIIRYSCMSPSFFSAGSSVVKSLSRV